MIGALIRRGRSGDRGTETQTGQSRDHGGRHWGIQLRLRNAKGCQHMAEASSKEGVSPAGFKGSVALLTPLFLTSDVQNWERINCCSKPPSYGNLLQQPWENNIASLKLLFEKSQCHKL